jgi:hypothetical protein
MSSTAITLSNLNSTLAVARVINPTAPNKGVTQEMFKLTTTGAATSAIATVQMPDNGLITINGIVQGYSPAYAAATAGTFAVSVLARDGDAELMTLPFILINSDALGGFDVRIAESGALEVTVTGVAATTYNWTCTFTKLIS